MNKSEAIQLFGTGAKLAKALGISESAVSQWPEESIPDVHALRIRYELKPEHFSNLAKAS